MQFSSSIVAFSLLALVASSPLPKKDKAAASSAVAACDSAASATAVASVAAVASASSTATSTKKAKAAKAAASTVPAAAAAGGDVLSAQAYNDFQISGPTAGTAESKANALFANIDMNNLASVSANDLKVIKGIHDAAEDAEVQAFNPAIEAASGDAATALQNGKIENKVLKLTAEVLGIQVDTAQGKTGGDLAAEQKKLANNIALDTAAAGQASTPVSFDATS